MTEWNSTLAKAAEAAFSEGPVDWQSLLESSSNHEERRVIENLRIIRGIADFNRLQMVGVASGEISRRIASDEPSEPDPPAEPSFPVIPSEEPLRTWGKFELRRKIGAGAYGDVYLAHDPDLEREVALKIYRSPAAGGGVQRQGPDGTAAAQDRRRTIMREARLMARVQHPNVVTVYGAEEIQGEVGLWMDYIKGQTLHEWVRAQGRLGAQEATVIGLDVCRALAAVHARGLIHQDVKAQNVMREEGGRIVLMDFGIGLGVPQESGEELQSGSGTPTYMAPEKLLQGATSIASDVYSLGVLIFYLVTGRYPVDAMTFSELLQAHKEGKRTLLRDARPELPAALIDVAEKAMSPDPKGRYASMGALEKALNGALGVAERVRFIPKKTAVSPPRRSWWVLMPALVLLAVVVWGAYRWSDRILPHRSATIRQITMNADGNPVRAIALSPDGKLLAYTDPSGAYLRDVDTGKTDPMPQLGGSVVLSLQWFPDGRKLLVGCQFESTVRTYALSLYGGVLEPLFDGAATLLPPDYNRLLVVDTVGAPTARELHGKIRNLLGLE
jgi:serine/threonine-protein kinase